MDQVDGSIFQVMHYINLCPPSRQEKDTIGEVEKKLLKLVSTVPSDLVLALLSLSFDITGTS